MVTWYAPMSLPCLHHLCPPQLGSEHAFVPPLCFQQHPVPPPRWHHCLVQLPWRRHRLVPLPWRCRCSVLMTFLHHYCFQTLLQDSFLIPGCQVCPAVQAASSFYQQVVDCFWICFSVSRTQRSAKKDGNNRVTAHGHYQLTETVWTCTWLLHCCSRSANDSLTFTADVTVYCARLLYAHTWVHKICKKQKYS